jgi:hypothetical protein
MHELVDLGHSMTNVVVGTCRDETRRSEHIGISTAEEGWTVANGNEVYLVAALNCNVLQQQIGVLNVEWNFIIATRWQEHGHEARGGKKKKQIDSKYHTTLSSLTRSKAQTRKAPGDNRRKCGTQTSFRGTTHDGRRGQRRMSVMMQRRYSWNTI